MPLRPSGPVSKYSTRYRESPSPQSYGPAVALLRSQWALAVAPVLQRIGMHYVFFCPTLSFECCLGGQVVGVRTRKDRKDISLLLGFVAKGIEKSGVDTFP